MKLGVVSDTHSKQLPQQMLEDFKRVDLIVHVGDFCDVEVYESLAKINRIEAVCGNMDSPQVCATLPQKKVLDLEGFKVGLFHGNGPPQGVLDKAVHAFKEQDLDVIIFGHTHQPFNQKVNNILFFNPGSPNDKIFAPYCSYGILEVRPEGITGNIVKVKK